MLILSRPTHVHLGGTRSSLLSPHLIINHRQIGRNQLERPKYREQVLAVPLDPILLRALKPQLEEPLALNPNRRKKVPIPL